MKFSAILFLSTIVWTGVACGNSNTDSSAEPQARPNESGASADSILADSLRVRNFPVDSLPTADRDGRNRYESLTDDDFRIVAEELGVEVAAIKAVVVIEAGKAMKGFYAPGVPVVNFDNSMYRVYGPKAPNRAGDKNAKVPAGLTGYALREWTQLTNARKVNSEGADMGTFWGMFQIGGFNYKLCGFENVKDFVAVMSESEFSQLEIFAKFITASGMLPDLKNKNWSNFARKYNGPSYKARGYHTRMAKAYNKFKAATKK